MLERYDKLRILAEKLDVVDKPELVRTWRQDVKNLCKNLTEEQSKIAILASSIEFVEHDMVKNCVLIGSLAYSVDDDEKTKGMFDLILINFEAAFSTVMKKIIELNLPEDQVPFSLVYQLFMEEIILLQEYQEFYVKLLIKYLLFMSPDEEKRQKNENEIKAFFGVDLTEKLDDNEQLKLLLK